MNSEINVGITSHLTLLPELQMLFAVPSAMMVKRQVLSTHQCGFTIIRWKIMIVTMLRNLAPRKLPLPCPAAQFHALRRRRLICPGLRIDEVPKLVEVGHVATGRNPPRMQEAQI